MLAELQLGAMHAESWKQDPKHLGFVLARYHFVARMLAGTARVLEVGCGDCTGARIVANVVGEWYGIDNNPILVNGAANIVIHDMTKGPPPYAPLEEFDAVYALDFLEHIQPMHESTVMRNICCMLDDDGVCIIGMPSRESQQYASPPSLEGHVNCKTEAELRRLMKRYFINSFLFGMNDGTLHTGFGPMCHYRLAIGSGVRRD